MIPFLVIMTGLGIWASIASLVVARRDGYRAEPTRRRLPD